MLSQYETKLTQNFLQSRQSTHGLTPSNGVGLAILHLKKTYFPITLTASSNLKEKKSQLAKAMATAYAQCVKEIWLYAKDNPHLQPAIQNMITKTESETDRWDWVTLYLPNATNEDIFYLSNLNDLDENDPVPNKGKVTSLMPLKQVLTLVWLALNDKSKFPAEIRKLNDEPPKETDQQLRLSSFFICLQDLQRKAVCHHGDRNELIFLLNGIYPGIKLIEDERATIYAYLKQHLSQRFWLKYEKQQDKKPVDRLLATAMCENNIRPVLHYADPNYHLATELAQMFIAEAVCPDDIRLTQKIKEALDHFPFQCHATRYQMHALRQKIVAFLEDDHYPERNRALTNMRNLLKKSDDDITATATIFYMMYNTHHQLSTYRGLLILSGKMDAQLEWLLQTSRDYFNACKDSIITPVISTEFKTAYLRIKTQLAECQVDTMFEWIRDFFAMWFDDKHDLDNMGNRIQLFNTLLNPKTHAKILMTNENIGNFITRNQDKPEVDIEPYELNRIMLTAIIIHPSKWSALFESAFNIALAFVNNQFNQDENHNAKEFYKKSYHANLRAQLNYLHGKRKQIISDSPDDIALKLIRPHISTMILMPDQITDFHNWRHIYSYLNAENRERYFNLLKFRLINYYFNLKEDNRQPSNLINYIGGTRWHDFINALNTNQLNIIRGMVRKYLHDKLRLRLTSWYSFEKNPAHAREYYTLLSHEKIYRHLTLDDDIRQHISRTLLNKKCNQDRDYLLLSHALTGNYQTSVEHPFTGMSPDTVDYLQLALWQINLHQDELALLQPIINKLLSEPCDPEVYEQAKKINYLFGDKKFKFLKSSLAGMSAVNQIHFIQTQAKWLTFITNFNEFSEIFSVLHNDFDLELIQNCMRQHIKTHSDIELLLANRPLITQVKFLNFISFQYNILPFLIHSNDNTLKKTFLAERAKHFFEEWRSACSGPILSRKKLIGGMLFEPALKPYLVIADESIQDTDEITHKIKQEEFYDELLNRLLVHTLIVKNADYSETFNNIHNQVISKLVPIKSKKLLALIGIETFKISPDIDKRELSEFFQQLPPSPEIFSSLSDWESCTWFLAPEKLVEIYSAQADKINGFIFSVAHQFSEMKIRPSNFLNTILNCALPAIILPIFMEKLTEVQLDCLQRSVAYIADSPYELSVQSFIALKQIMLHDKIRQYLLDNNIVFSSSMVERIRGEYYAIPSLPLCELIADCYVHPSWPLHVASHYTQANENFSKVILLLQYAYFLEKTPAKKSLILSQLEALELRNLTALEMQNLCLILDTIYYLENKRDNNNFINLTCSMLLYLKEWRYQHIFILELYDADYGKLIPGLAELSYFINQMLPARNSQKLMRHFIKKFFEMNAPENANQVVELFSILPAPAHPILRELLANDSNLLISDTLRGDIDSIKQYDKDAIFRANFGYLLSIATSDNVFRELINKKIQILLNLKFLSLRTAKNLLSFQLLNYVDSSTYISTKLLHGYDCLMPARSDGECHLFMNSLTLFIDELNCVPEAYRDVVKSILKSHIKKLSRQPDYFPQPAFFSSQPQRDKVHSNATTTEHLSEQSFRKK